MPRGQPGVAVDDIGCHEGVLEVEDGELAVGREHRPLATFFPGQGARPGAGGEARPGGPVRGPRPPVGRRRGSSEATPRRRGRGRTSSRSWPGAGR